MLVILNRSEWLKLSIVFPFHWDCEDILDSISWVRCWLCPSLQVHFLLTCFMIQYFHDALFRYLRTGRVDAKVLRSYKTRCREHFRWNYWINKEINIWIFCSLLMNLERYRIPSKFKALLVINDFFDWLVGKRSVSRSCELWKVVPSQKLFPSLNIVSHFLGTVRIVLYLNAHLNTSTESCCPCWNTSSWGWTCWRTCHCYCCSELIEFFKHFTVDLLRLD